MSEILKLINKNLGSEQFPKKSWGKIYFQENSSLNIDRSTYNDLLNKCNSIFERKDGDTLTIYDDLLLVFIGEKYEDNSSKWTRLDRNYEASTIFLEWGIISFCFERLGVPSNIVRTKNHKFSLSWESVDFVELFEDENDNHFFRFYEKGKTEHHDLFSNRFGTHSLVASKKLVQLLNDIVDYKKISSPNSVFNLEDLKLKIENLVENENYEELLTVLENFKNINKVEDVSISTENTSMYYLAKTNTLIKLERYELALNTIDNYIKKCNELNEIDPYAYLLRGEILINTKNFIPAIKSLAFSEENYENDDDKSEAIKLKNNSYLKLKEIFLKVPYNERKLIFIGKDIYATKSSEIIILKKNDLPLNVNFPVGHPHINEVYTCHPHKQDFYLPIKSYREELFLDRIHEFSWLLQCLGATKLEISSSKSDFSDQTVRSKKEVDSQIDYKLSGAKLNYQEEHTDNALIDGKLDIAKKQIFNPTKSPFLPDNLVWYHSNTSWQRLSHQRLNGSITIHNELISSSQSETVSTHELKQVEAELKLLLPKIGVKYNSEDEVNISSIKKYEWMVHVEFADVNNLLEFKQRNKIKPAGILNLDSENYNLKLERYKEDVLIMLEDDGVIDESERNILNRKMKKYGISEEDARAIENELATSGFAENELNYIEELKEILMDGEINDIERKILDRYAVKFKIEKDKQMEIDTLFIK